MDVFAQTSFHLARKFRTITIAEGGRVLSGDGIPLWSRAGIYIYYGGSKALQGRQYLCLHPSPFRFSGRFSTLFRKQSLIFQLRVNSCSICGMGREGLSGPAVVWFVCSVINSPDLCPRPQAGSLSW